MKIKTRILNAASAANTAIFKRASRHPGRNNKDKLFDEMYDMDYVKGRGYKEYRRMMKDPQIKVGVSIIKLFLASRELKITSASDAPEDIAAAQFVEDNISDLSTSMRKVRKNLYTALPYGFSACEVVYKIGTDGLIRIKGFYSIHRKTLEHPERFEYNDYGDLINIIQDVDGEKIPIPIDKVLLYSFDEEFDEPEGNSILEEIYDNFFIKSKIFKWLAIFLQKNENPTTIGKSSNAKYAKKMNKQLEEISEGRTQMTIGKDDDVFVLESAHRGEGFFKAIGLHDNVIFRRLFLGTLLFGQDATSGSYAQSQTQFDVTKMLLDGVHEEIAEPLEKHFARLVNMNYSAAQPPKIGFEKFENKDIISLLNALKPYTDNMTIDADSAWFRELVAAAVKELSGVIVDKENISGYNMEENPENPGSIAGDEDTQLEAQLNALFP
jgi:hypothetical protein